MEAVKERRKTKTKKKKDKTEKRDETPTSSLPRHVTEGGASAVSDIAYKDDVGKHEKTETSKTNEALTCKTDQSDNKEVTASGRIENSSSAASDKADGNLEKTEISKNVHNETQSRKTDIDQSENTEASTSDRDTTKEIFDTKNIVDKAGSHQDANQTDSNTTKLKTSAPVPEHQTAAEGDKDKIQHKNDLTESSININQELQSNVSQTKSDSSETVCQVETTEDESYNLVQNSAMGEKSTIADIKLYPDITQEITDLQSELEKVNHAVEELRSDNVDQLDKEHSGELVQDQISDSQQVADVTHHHMADTVVGYETKVAETVEAPVTNVECMSTALPDEKIRSDEGTVEYSKGSETEDAVAETVESPEAKVESTAPLEAEIRLDEETKLSKQKTLEVQMAEKERVKPLTIEQLHSLYTNERLEANFDLINKFVESELKKDYPEFYEIMLSYERARKNLIQTEEALAALENRYKELEEELWITETKSTTVKGVCGDNARCTSTVSYQQARLNDTALTQLTKTLDSIKEQIQQSLCLHAYSALLSRLQVESFLHNLIVTSPVLYEIPRNLPVYGCERHTSNVAHQVARLRMCISVLFAFHRTPIEDEEMLTNLRHWTERLVSPLLRIGTFEDHLFILNHIMRCPAGVGSWAAHLIQAPPIPTNDHLHPLMFGNPCFDHVITALATVLIPTSGRPEFLYQMQKVFTPHGGDKKGISWVLVDEDGEEDEDPQNSWLYLHENDVVALLRQLSMADIFTHVFFITHSPYNDSMEYEIEKTAGSTMYRVYAFCTCLVRLLGTGMKTYSMSRYRQLNKRLGRMIRQTVQYTSDHWGNFKQAKYGMMSVELLDRLQLEFDSFFLRAVDAIHTAQRLGSWQFIADMPFNNISKDTMWRLLWLLYQGHGQSVDVVDIPSVEECISLVQGGVSQLADILQHVGVSEGVYLLNTMTNMIEACSSADLHIIETVTNAVFQVSYVCPETRDSCSKMGRELLSAVVKCHPFILSKLLQIVHEHTDKLGPMGLYLYKGLGLHAWLPSDPDLVILRQWLLNTSLGSHTHMLAQLILSNINWAKSHKGDRLLVPWKVHKQVSVLIVEAYQKFILGKHLGSVIMEGVKQVSAAVQQYSTTEQEFNAWCWDLLIKLSLHRSSLPSADQRLAEIFHTEILDVNKDDSLLPLFKGNKEKNATACFVTLMLTKFGHSETDFLHDGVPLLQVLVDQGLSKPSICVLNCIVPMFTDTPTKLLQNESFSTILYSLLQSDESYFKVVKGLLSYDFPGPITKLFTSMVMSHVDTARSNNKDRMLPIIGLWMKLLMKYQKWYSDRNYCYVLDQLIASSFTYEPAMEGVQTIIQDIYKQFCADEKSGGVVSSFVSWVTSGTYLPSFLESTSCPEFPWLAYTLLCLEGNFELSTQLWDNMQGELLSSSKVTIEQALKKAKNRLKLDQAPTSSNLSLYRFAHQALDMPVNHPAAVLTWQRFFVVFLGRMDAASHPSTSQRGSVGEKFFTGMSYYSMRKKLKKRLKETSDYYMKCTAETNSNTEEDRNKKDMYNKLTRIFQTFELWVDEPLLHDATLYLPSLPPQYMADRLHMVFQKNVTPWLEFIDITEIEESIVTMATEWRLSNSCSLTHIDQSDNRKHAVTMSGKERILSRLERCEKPLPPPPVHPVSAPVPDVSPALLEDKTALLHLLQADMDMLKQHASQFCSRMAQQEILDDKYVRLIPHLYRNVPRERVVSLECTSMINPLHKCYKPGSATVKYDEKCANPIEQRQADDNRQEYKQVMTTNRMPPAQNIVISAVHTENTITMLVKLFRSVTDKGRLQNINNIGCSLFFLLGDAVDRHIQSYPPTQQFFSSCIDVLGQNFIQKDGSQTSRLLELSISRPELGGLLSPHFTPNMNHGMFGPMYSMLLKPLQNKHTELTFMLITKFDVKTWLTDYRPGRQELQKFVETLGQALCMCGVDPDQHHTLVFGQYIGHEKIVLQHKFPQNIHEILAALLQGSSVDKLSETCWTTFHQICYYGNASCDVQQEYPDVFTDLSTEQITNIIQWLGHEFTQIRLNQKEASAFGLYPKWKRYVPHLANLLQDLSKCLMDKMMPTLRDATSNECLDSLWKCIIEGFGPWTESIYISKVAGMPWIQDDCNTAVYMVQALKHVVGYAHIKTIGLDSLWKCIIEGFGPWIECIYISKVAGMPWIQDDCNTAVYMVQALKHVVGYAHIKTIEIRGKFYNDFLSLLWLYFSTTLCKADVSPWVISVYNLEFQQLPWKQLYPNIQVMETLVGLKEHGGSLGFNLVSDIISVIDWPRVKILYEQSGNPDTVRRYEGCLFLLFIQACAEKKYMENPDMEAVLSHAETNRWENLSPDVYRKSCSWFLHDSDSRCILLARSDPHGIGVRLLKAASGFTTEISQVLTEDWMAKRQCYLHTLSALVCQVTFLQDWQPDALKTLIVNLLTEIETVESAVLDVYTQHQECSDMVKEILTLLNNCNPDNQGSQVVMDTWLDWLRDSPQTILLSPCIHAATRSVASLTYMVQIVELCIELTFVPGGARKVSDPWMSVLAALQIPELNVTEFFSVCIQESAFLLLHCYILQRVPLCQSLSDKHSLIEVILDWMDRVKPSADNESKLLLWWHKVLNLILCQLDYGEDVSTCVKLLRKYMSTVQIMGEDRQSGGLLGAIGFGKKSPLSEKFRLCSRAVVAFLSQQILSDDKVRVNLSTPVSNSTSTKQDLSSLTSLKTNKKYQPIKMETEMLCEFVTDQSKCLRDVLLLVKTLRTCFYSNISYLSVIDSINM